ncbi:MAG TPA: hypothetical protein VEJ20_08025 [Candidatus Eremiobacteraceae bacterium]|nr:hypothetical protein [Candidatus Eremiobacteraceae bacterium]
MRGLGRVLFPALLAVALVCATARVANADPRDFNFSNDSGHVVVHLYISPHGDPDWGSDVLGQSVLDPGDWTRIYFSGDVQTCYYDLAVVDENGNSYYEYGENLCDDTGITFK